LLTVPKADADDSLGAVALLLSLCLVMQARPFGLWSLVSVTIGSSSDRRAMLVDRFVRHFPDWWLVRTNQNETWEFEMWDTSNRHVEEGETGGLAAF
jgi:hypothetical protein